MLTAAQNVDRRVALDWAEDPEEAEHEAMLERSRKANAIFAQSQAEILPGSQVVMWRKPKVAAEPVVRATQQRAEAQVVAAESTQHQSLSAERRTMLAKRKKLLAKRQQANAR